MAGNAPVLRTEWGSAQMPEQGRSRANRTVQMVAGRDG
jgi:hypothetical protein